MQVNNDKAQKDSSNSSHKPLLKDAPPSWHSVALLTLFVAMFARRLPSLQGIDEAATIATFTNRVFPDFMSIQTLGMIRVAMAIVIWATSIYTILFDPVGFIICTAYPPHSKLINTSFPIKGWKSLAPFTHWCWIVLGLAFSLQGAIALDVAFGVEHHISPWMLRGALVSFEIAAPLSFLVSAVVAHAIWPKAKSLQDLKHPRTLLMHNANIIFALIEVCLLGGTPVRGSDIAFAPLFGCLYVLVAWNSTKLFVPVETEGPQFLYHFMDTTIPKKSTIALIVLLFVIMVAYFIFSKIQNVLDMLGGGLLYHTMAVGGIAKLTCRFR
jgi:hypothetical protein